MLQSRSSFSGARKKSDELTIAIVPAGTSFSRRLAGSLYSTCSATISFFDQLNSVPSIHGDAE